MSTTASETPRQVRRRINKENTLSVSLLRTMNNAKDRDIQIASVVRAAEAAIVSFKKQHLKH